MITSVHGSDDDGPRVYAVLVHATRAFKQVILSSVSGGVVVVVAAAAAFDAAVAATTI